MVKIDKYISDLLRDNECVIVPKMGGFISSHSRDGIQDWQSNSAKLSFNALLDYNDGLLENLLVKQERLTYTEALIEIERFVGEFHHEMNAGKKFVIERVGTLYMDEGSKVLIEPFKAVETLETVDAVIEEVLPVESKENQPLASSPIEYEQEVIIKQEEPVNIPASLDSPAKLPRQKFIFFRKSIITASLVLTAIILGYCLYIYFSSPSDSETELQAATEISVSEQPIGKNQSESVVLVPSIDPVPANVDVNSRENNFYIIAGSFKSLDNAKRKLEELKQQGFLNAQIFSDNRHLQLVCYGSFSNLAEANDSLNSIKQQHQEAWIYSR